MCQNIHSSSLYPQPRGESHRPDYSHAMHTHYMCICLTQETSLEGHTGISQDSVWQSRDTPGQCVAVPGHSRRAGGSGWTHLFSCSTLSILFHSLLTSISCSCSRVFSRSIFSRRNCTHTHRTRVRTHLPSHPPSLTHQSHHTLTHSHTHSLTFSRVVCFASTSFSSLLIFFVSFEICCSCSCSRVCSSCTFSLLN